jgi:hypothetical protein
MEAEVRKILAQSLGDEPPQTSQAGRFSHLVGVWKDRLTTDQVLTITRGE